MRGKVQFFALSDTNFPVPTKKITPEDILHNRLPSADVIVLVGKGESITPDLVSVLSNQARVIVICPGTLQEYANLSRVAHLVLPFPPTLVELTRAIGWALSGGEPLMELAKKWNGELIYSVCGVSPSLSRFLEEEHERSRDS